MANMIGYNLMDVFTNDVREKAQVNKVYLVWITTLESSQFVVVNKTSTLTMAWSVFKLFFHKTSGQCVVLLIHKSRHTKMVEGEDLYEHLTTMLNLVDEL